MTEIIATAAVVLVAWFAAGTIWNVSRGRAFMRWMQGGLSALGERTTVRWLGSTAVEMVIRHGKAPFTNVTLLIFLEPRDTPWTWAIGRASGRRDTLIIRGGLCRIPDLELEGLDSRSWSGRDALPRVPRAWPVRQAAIRGAVDVHHASAAALTRAHELLTLAHHAGLEVKRLSVRRAEPNFQLHILLPSERQRPDDFFNTVRTLADRATA